MLEKDPTKHFSWPSAKDETCYNFICIAWIFTWGIVEAYCCECWCCKALKSALCIHYALKSPRILLRLADRDARDRFPNVWIQMYFWRYDGSQRLRCKINTVSGALTMILLALCFILCLYFHAHNGELKTIQTETEQKPSFVRKRLPFSLVGTTKYWMETLLSSFCFVFFWSEFHV